MIINNIEVNKNIDTCNKQFIKANQKMVEIDETFWDYLFNNIMNYEIPEEVVECFLLYRQNLKAQNLMIQIYNSLNLNIRGTIGEELKKPPIKAFTKS